MAGAQAPPHRLSLNPNWRTHGACEGRVGQEDWESQLGCPLQARINRIQLLRSSHHCASLLAMKWTRCWTGIRSAARLADGPAERSVRTANRHRGTVTTTRRSAHTSALSTSCAVVSNWPPCHTLYERERKELPRVLCCHRRNTFDHTTDTFSSPPTTHSH